MTAAPKPSRLRVRIDPSSPEYRAAARKYTAFLIAMPIFLVTSWALFNRLALGAQVKTLPREPAPAASSTAENGG
ncbi:hypothetical protein GGS23DRAFT_600852 [Durotheca rogersii]|uniref:uncharacterized protein n=1 Tax=Durotheca rogersii TaxID=419775 RepID=UPI002220A966|nr:uncharacterized protein GGS23DRAFT_600852 [Durotheca rogersii]KAI5857364.1 hypothetical protein GGS23DRAFT_600852 [Durotheca rogersii]